jgi:very-short-patch-repair endonuclease
MRVGHVRIDLKVTRTTRARAHRQRTGLAETAVWRVLRAGGSGFKFRRQHPIGPYFIDFACTPLRLAIEIDGGVHSLLEVAARDAERQAALEELGWTVLRFNEDVAIARPTEIVAAVEMHAAAIAGRPAPIDPHPTPLRGATFSQWEKE